MQRNVKFFCLRRCLSPTRSALLRRGRPYAGCAPAGGLDCNLRLQPIAIGGVWQQSLRDCNKGIAIFLVTIV